MAAGLGFCSSPARRQASRLCKKPSLGCAGGKPNPLNPPYQGDLSLNSPLTRGQGGLEKTNIGFLHSLFRRNDGRAGFLLLACAETGFETVQETLARLRWRKTQPPKSPLSGGLVTQFPPDKGARGVRKDEYWIFAQSLSQE